MFLVIVSSRVPRISKDLSPTSDLVFLDDRIIGLVEVCERDINTTFS